MLAYARLIHYYYTIWTAIVPYEAEEMNDPPFISVIIPFRNEAVNLPSLLNCFEALDYPHHKLQVIFIDDDSNDESASLIKASMTRMPFVELQALEFNASGENIPYKKRAIETGIAVANGEWIVTTDADCCFQPAWLKTIASFSRKHHSKCIAAPVKITPERNLLSVFQSLDFLTLQGITGAAVSGGSHMMCNGANFAYTKAVFQEVDGFSGIDNIPSGDDMLLIQKIFALHPTGVHYLKSELAVVETAASPNWNTFFQQRIRWASKSTHYKDKTIILILALVWCFNLCFLAMAVIVAIYTKWIFLLLLFLAAKWLIEYAFVASVASFFKLSRLMKYFLPLQPLHIIYTVIAGFLGQFGSYEWKGRRVKKPAA